MAIYMADNTLVATTPRHIVTADGTAITSFRVAEPTNDSSTNNWFVVTIFGKNAVWAKDNISKGERWDFHGPLRIRDWDNGETTGTSVEIEAFLVRKAGTFDQHECDCSNHNQ